MDHMHHTHHEILAPIWEAVFVGLAIAAIGNYIVAVMVSNRKSHLSRWQNYRFVFWVGGVLSALAVMAGPLKEVVHTNFTTHMLGHLLLGMLAPLLLVLSAPIKLMLRALPTSAAQIVTKVMRSKYVQFITHPITASVLNIGGLWVLYTTSLFQLMHEHGWLYLFVHLHVFLAGYVFTAAFVYIDPNPHRYSFMYRSVVFMLALAAHQILSKYIYAYPPAGVTRDQAEAGGMLMYYGGGVIDAIIIYLICLNWYRSARPRVPAHQM